jgi:hypothetical protein
MQVMHEVCCGLDVHKKGVTACVLWASGRLQRREFGTFRVSRSRWNAWPTPPKRHFLRNEADVAENRCAKYRNSRKIRTLGQVASAAGGRRGTSPILIFGENNGRALARI